MEYSVAKYETKQRRRIRRNISLIVITSLILYLIYPRLFPQIEIEFSNVILFVLSVSAVVIGILDILKNGVMINNVFLACYFFFLAINNLNISGLQCSKGFVETYYLIAGPLLFCMIIRMFDKKRIRTYITSKSKLSPNIVGSFLIIITLILKLLIIERTGIRLLDANWAGGGTGAQYNVGGITGLYQICIWSLLILVPRLNKSLKIIAVVMAVLFDVFFAISRNNAVILFTFLLMAFAITKKKRFLIDKKVVRGVFIMVAVAIVGFALFGNYRQTMRGWSDPSASIARLLGSKTDNALINWLYGYTAINYDVLLQFMTTADHPMSMYSVLSPYVRLLAGKSSLSEYHDAVYHIKALNGFNASTMFGPMVYEMGVFYIIQVFFLSVQVGLFGLIARKERAEGLYAYLISFAALSVFGDFYSIPIFFYISIAAMILHFLLLPEHEDEQYDYHKTNK